MSKPRSPGITGYRRVMREAIQAAKASGVLQLDYSAERGIAEWCDVLDALQLELTNDITLRKQREGSISAELRQRTKRATKAAMTLARHQREEVTP